jgi:hypothetical protein
MAQPIIRGIQAIGSVAITYTYNAKGTTHRLAIPTTFTFGDKAGGFIDTDGGVEITGFRLDGEFLRAAQQIATSYVIPLLGGGGVALTNNNRSGTLSISSTRVSSPQVDPDEKKVAAMAGLDGGQRAYDLVLLAQCQQAADGGDSVGADIEVKFDFQGKGTTITFESCTVADVSPVALAGNDTPNYNVSYNYLSWKASFSSGPTSS